MTELTRDYETLQQTYRNLLAKKQESQIATNLERRQIGEQFKILDSARLPEKPSSPDRPRLYSIAIAASVLVGLLFAAAAEYFDRALRTEEDVRLVINVPVIATIPMIERASPSRRTLAVAATSGAALVAALAAVRWTLLR
jgi:capsular polysaccharide biosynthesis protein